MAGGRYFVREVVPLAAMLTAETANVGSNILYKAAVTKGLSYHVFMAYSYAVSVIVLLPLSYLFHRKTVLPPFSIGVLGKLFMLGFLGFPGQYLGYIGIKYSSPTVGSAMSNLIPAFTFFLAVLFRMEKLKVRSLSSQAKIFGALASISGALVVVLYDGPIVITGRDGNLHSPIFSIILHTISSSRSKWILGGALLAAAYIIASFWYILQAMFIKEYPAELVFILFYNLSGFILAVPIGIASEPHLSSWIVPADIRLVACLFSGLVGSAAFTLVIHAWCLHKKGPVYVAFFKPLSIAITAIFGVIFLGDYLYLGSVIGSVIISMGFYTVMWAKFKEEISETSDEDEDNRLESSNSDAIVPLLKHSTNENAGA
ncbi:hypothetical protein BUALT_Bualt04G0155900 [Buddleja alternifolia]|uniref:WAT1-related protein n=1 Tax=Buddleja alternifolia TaxID=168488 RepID=A0AAV6XQP1_9LAMI|nr:hypothetical protein BUALT_Bualt04G0155900 [Buddleja alternifolia]